MNNSILEKRKQHNECARLYRMGKYDQSEIAERVGVSRQTINKWICELPGCQLHSIRRNLTKQLNALAAARNYATNGEMIRNLIADIERVDELIKQAENGQK